MAVVVYHWTIVVYYYDMETDMKKNNMVSELDWAFPHGRAKVNEREMEALSLTTGLGLIFFEN